MRILLISLFLPQARATHAGARYVYEVLRHLSEQHAVTLVTRCAHDETQALGELRPLCAELHVYPYRTSRSDGLGTALRLAANYLGFSHFARRLAHSGGYDLVRVEWVEAAALLGQLSAPLVIDAMDVLTKPAARRLAQARGVSRAPAWLVHRATRRLERRILRHATVVMTLSEYDRRYLSSFLPEAAVHVIPVPAGLDIAEPVAAREPATLLFLGSYARRPTNVAAVLWFYREVFPHVKRAVPAARFVVAGHDPPPVLTALATEDPAVTVSGYVADASALYQRATVFVAPVLVGGGIIVKVLDALAAGAATVTTTFGNEGVAACPERDLLVADDPADFARAVIRLLTDANLRSNLGRQGQAFVRAHYGRSSVFERLDQAHAAALRAHKPPPR